MLLATCGNSVGTHSDGGDVVSVEQAVAPIPRDIEFMAFLHRFAEDPEFQMLHIKFPLGKLTYANIMKEDGEYYPDDFTERYWCLYDGAYMRGDGAGYFTWVNDNKIVFDYNSSMLDEDTGEFGTTYTFEKIDGEWYVTAGDYYGSDVGIADYLAQEVASQNERFRKDHTEPYKPYVYNGTPGDFPQASDRRLKDKDLEGLNAQQLRLMRNEIMARHGYCFKNEELKAHFNAKPWYSGLFKDVDVSLTDIERKNLKLIKAHEKIENTKK